MNHGLHGRHGWGTEIFPSVSVKFGRNEIVSALMTQFGGDRPIASALRRQSTATERRP